jgi:hypothetical protein
MFHRIYEWYKARRRGERRIAPTGVRGRVYASRDKNKADGIISAKAEPTAVIHMKVTRKDGTVEYITVPATAQRVSDGKHRIHTRRRGARLRHSR